MLNYSRIFCKDVGLREFKSLLLEWYWSVNIIKSWNFLVQVVGLWVNETWEIEHV